MSNNHQPVASYYDSEIRMVNAVSDDIESLMKRIQEMQTKFAAICDDRCEAVSHGMADVLDICNDAWYRSQDLLNLLDEDEELEDHE
jgi:hypothetical protein